MRISRGRFGEQEERAAVTMPEWGRASEREGGEMAAAPVAKLGLTFTLLTSTALLGPGFVARAQQVEAPKVDLYGDPLPDKAVARMGTVLLRHPLSHIGIATAFAPDSRLLATHDG